jgi:hypothetical protein
LRYLEFLRKSFQHRVAALAYLPCISDEQEGGVDCGWKGDDGTDREALRRTTHKGHGGEKKKASTGV